MKNKVTPQGFTLLEILIALSIFSIMAVITTTVLFSVFNARDNTTKHAVMLSQLQVAFVLIERDITQIVNRPVKYNLGQQNGVVGMNNEVTFSRGGVINPLFKQKKSSISRVSYKLTSSNKLERTSTIAADNLKNAHKFREVLLSNITSLSFEYIDKNKQAKNQWYSSKLPLAIRITIVHKDWGKLSQIYTLSQVLKYYEKFKQK